jgi:hypothetical protein
VNWVELVNAAEYIGAAAFIGMIALAIYFFPSIIAGLNRKRNMAAIVMLNLFLGWTLLGWVVALVWAFMTETPAAIKQTA